MNRVDIKALSVNRAYKGRRFKTDAYKAYEWELYLRLPPMVVPDGPLAVHYIFGVQTLADWDGPVKLFQDILQKKYGFDDRRIMFATVEKVVVKKGKEFIEFKIMAR